VTEKDLGFKNQENIVSQSLDLGDLIVRDLL
jgi:hypothetical protein